MLNKEWSNFIKMKFVIAEKDLSRIRIKSIRCGSNADILSITLESRKQDQALIWSVKGQKETHLYDIHQDNQIIWSTCGFPILCSSKYSIIPRIRWSGTCFDRSSFFNGHFDNNKFKLISIQGHRLDHVNHNWLLIREHLSLAFSYMSFVIRTQSILDE